MDGDAVETDSFALDQEGGSLKASSSFHPVEHGTYNLWLNDEKNLKFFSDTPKTRPRPKILPKMGQESAKNIQSQKFARPPKSKF